MNKRSFLIGIGIGIMIGAALLQLMLVGQRQSEGLKGLADGGGEDKLYSQAELDDRLAEQKSRIESQMSQKDAGDPASAEDDGDAATPPDNSASGQPETDSDAGEGEAGRSGSVSDAGSGVKSDGSAPTNYPANAEESPTPDKSTTSEGSSTSDKSTTSEGSPTSDQPANADTSVAAGESEADDGGGDAGRDEARKIVRIPPNMSVKASAELLFDNGIISDKQSFTDLMRTSKVRAGYFAFEGKPSLEEVKRIITSKPLPPDEAEAELAAASSGG